MPISPQQQYSEYGLLVPRSTIKFRDVSDIPGVRVESVNSGVESKVKPIIRTGLEPYDFEGVASGGRNGLVIIDGIPYKVKGCNIEEAFRGNGLYTATHFVDNPKGGLQLRLAKDDLVKTNEIHKLLTREDFPIPYEPEALVQYGRFYQEKEPNEFFEKYADFLEAYGKVFPALEKMFQFMANGLRSPPPEELGAAVWKIRGDTRLSEIYNRRERSQEAVQEVGYRFGLSVGAQQKITEQWYWSGNWHAGNIVAFGEDIPLRRESQIYLAKVDFDGTIRAEDIKNPKDKLLYKATNKLFLWSLFIGSSGLPRYWPINKAAASKNFRRAFKQGFYEGFDNTDRRQPVTLEMLLDAFELNIPVLE